MAILDVRCPRDPLARLEVRDARSATVAAGSGAVVVEVGAGLYEVVADAAGRRSDQVVRVVGGEKRLEVVVTLPQPSPGSVPALGRDGDVVPLLERIGDQLARASAGEGGLALVVPRTAGRERDGGRRPLDTPGEPAVTGVGTDATVALAWAGDAGEEAGGPHRWATAAVEPGLYAVGIGGARQTGLVLPVWPGWTTLLILPLLRTGPAPWLAAVHCVPLPPSGSDAALLTQLTELTGQLHAAMTVRAPVTAEGLRRFEGLLRTCVPPGDGPLPPLARLMLAHVALAQADPDAAALGRAWALEAGDDDAATGIVAADVVALRVRVAEARGGDDKGGGLAVPPSSLPVLASSAGALLRHEARRPGALAGTVAAALGARLTSPVWFRWDRDEDHRPGPVPGRFDEDAWRDEVAALARRSPGTDALDRLAHDVRLDPAVARLAAHLADAAHVLREEPADVLLHSHVGELVLATGVPAARLLDGLGRLNAIPPPPPWWRRPALGVVLAVLVALGALAVWPGPDGPRFAVADVLVLEEDTSRSLEPLGNDEDPERLSIREVGEADHGSVVLSGRVVTYTPEPDYAGSDEFTYTASDGEDDSSAAVRVDVRPVNDAPAAEDDRLQIAEGESGSVDVVGNDRDADGDALTVVRVDRIGRPALGAVSIAGPRLEYTPRPGARGTERYSYEVSDGKGGAARAVLTVEIASANAAPVAEDDRVETGQEQPVTIRPLGNDVDPDGTPLDAEVVEEPKRGTLAPAGSGMFTYRPEKGFIGTDRFTYRASDGLASSDPATVTVVVSPLVTVGDVSVEEGPVGSSPRMGFTVRLSGGSDETATVRFRTRPGTAASPGDYAAVSVTVTFAPGQTQRTVTVRVNGDSDVEADETFRAELSDPANAVIPPAGGQGTGTIQNDDSVVD